MLFPIVIALLVAGVIAYYIFKGKKKLEIVPSVTPVVKKPAVETEEVGYESAPVVVEEKPKKARKPRAKKNA